jgi:hypothetical protein
LYTSKLPPALFANIGSNLGGDAYRLAQCGLCLRKLDWPVANPNSASTTVTMGAAESVTANFVSALTVSPASFNFGTEYLGAITITKVTVTNSGATALAINNPSYQF